MSLTLLAVPTVAHAGTSGKRTTTTTTTTGTATNGTVTSVTSTTTTTTATTTSAKTATTSTTTGATTVSTTSGSTSLTSGTSTSGPSLLSSTTSKLSGTTTTLANTTNATTTAMLSDPSVSAKAPPSVFNASSLTVEPQWGKIRSFWGKIRSFDGEEVTPFWGKIRSFWGNASPFEGDTSNFWGTLKTYNDGITPGKVTPEWGKIRSFWDVLGTQWGSIRTYWDSIGTSYASNPLGYSTLATQLKSVVTTSETFWGPTVQATSGKSFSTAFAAPLLARYGIDLNKPATLAALDPNEREHFFLEWYDGLMQYSGVDNPDHWMRQINWTPSLTQTIGAGADTVIGLLDFTVTGTDASRITNYDGVSTFSNGHGAAVASLMIAAHDGKGVMGIAPKAKVVAFNPFDATETADWVDIKEGLITLGDNRASIINMSLGVPGWTLPADWNTLFTMSDVQEKIKKTVLVIAAGNDGLAQTTNIAWDNPANIIVVGSVDPSQTISDFSNRPGSACLLTSGKCVAGNELKNRFIVAPGEMILVADGKGGVTRYSGTSFAAPLVSGAVALIHDRWTWLANYPKETVQIILKSATDLGAPGVDDVYGVGQLNVLAALSPLDFNKLSWTMRTGSTALPIPVSQSVARDETNLSKWEADGVYFSAYEQIGGTYRDFLIPMSTQLFGQSAKTSFWSSQFMQSYLYNQMIDWMKSGYTDAKAPSLNLASSSVTMPNAYGLNLTMSMAPRSMRLGYRGGNQLPYQTAMQLSDPNGHFALTLGEGDGAIELADQIGFGRASDFESGRGGVSPLLGMASGGSYGKFSYAIAKKLTLSAGLTEQEERYSIRDIAPQQRASFKLDGYRTSARAISLRYDPSHAVSLSASYSQLVEPDAVLGVQTLDPAMLGRGSASQAATLGASFRPSRSLMIALTATAARTDSRSRNALLSTGAGGFQSTAFQAAITKTGLLSNRDSLHVSVAQPLYIEQGKLTLTQVEVVDRQTGALGEVTHSFNLAARKRPLVGEFSYKQPLMGGSADIALFGKAQLAGDVTGTDPARLTAGARFKLRF